MATFRHATPGSIVTSKRLIVSDAVTSDGDTKFTIEQPANSAINKVIVRNLDAITFDESAVLKVSCGTALDGTQVFAFDNLLSGTTLAANTLLVPAITAGVSDADTGSVVTDERDLHFTLNANATLTATGNGRIEFTVVYRVFD
tara:strand:+ start:359 stop:790 length:432 start_codon:yes stop_codon:yes gene_type:complete